MDPLRQSGTSKDRQSRHHALMIGLLASLCVGGLGCQRGEAPAAAKTDVPSATEAENAFPQSSPALSSPRQTAQFPVLKAPSNFDGDQSSNGELVMRTSAADLAEEVPQVDPATLARQKQAERLYETIMTPGTRPDEWDRAQQDLIGLGADALPPLLRELREGDRFEREIASSTLALIGSKAASAADEMKAALEDESAFVRANAAATLVQIPGHSAAVIPVLVDLLRDEDPQLRELAAMNLSAIGAEAAPYLGNLERILAEDSSPEVLRPVVELMGRIGAPAEAAVPRLQQIKFEQPGELGDAARTAIQLITESSRAEP